MNHITSLCIPGRWASIYGVAPKEITDKTRNMLVDAAYAIIDENGKGTGKGRVKSKNDGKGQGKGKHSK